MLWIHAGRSCHLERRKPSQANKTLFLKTIYDVKGVSHSLSGLRCLCHMKNWEEGNVKKIII
jgi:hypothetical protein